MASSSNGNAAASAAKKGVGMLFNATKTGLSALSMGVTMARNSYGNKHETSVLADLRNKGLTPLEYLFQPLYKVYFLFMAGYEHELVAVSQQAAKRLTDQDKSSVPLEAVLTFGHSVCHECLKYGDFSKGKFEQSMKDFFNKARMSNNHFDRDALVHDLYYALLVVTEITGAELQTLDQVFREATNYVIQCAVQVASSLSDSSVMAAKAMYLFGSEMKACSQEAEGKRQKALKNAEDLLIKEQNRQRTMQHPSTTHQKTRYDD